VDHRRESGNPGLLQNRMRPYQRNTSAAAGRRMTDDKKRCFGDLRFEVQIDSTSVHRTAVLAGGGWIWILRSDQGRLG
jgi:hypothetical protein